MIVAAKPIMVYVIMLNVKIYHSMLSVITFPTMPRIVMLSVILLIVTIKPIVMHVIKLSVTIYPTMLSIIIMSVIMLSGIYALVNVDCHN
jgi:hypothetical protein